MKQVCQKMKQFGKQHFGRDLDLFRKLKLSEDNVKAEKMQGLLNIREDYVQNYLNITKLG